MQPATALASPVRFPQPKQLLQLLPPSTKPQPSTFVIELIDDLLWLLLLSSILSAHPLVQSSIEPPPPPSKYHIRFYYIFTSSPNSAPTMSESWVAPAAAADAWGCGGDDAATNGGAGDAGAEPVGIVEDPEAKAKKEEFLKKARDAGWTEATAFDYSEFLRTGGEASYSRPTTCESHANCS